MAGVPRYTLFIDPIVRYLAPRASPIAFGEICESVADALQLSVDARRAELNSGGPVYKSRARWALNWLKRAGLAHAPATGEWQLTVVGRKLAVGHPVLTAQILSEFADKVKGHPSNADRVRFGRPPSRPAESLGNKKAYRLKPRPLAIGGQAEVYEATRKADNKILVFKRVLDPFRGDRMRREIEVQSSLKHVGIMPILDWDRSKFTWYVMPRGSRSMADLNRPVEPCLIFRIVGGIVSALEFAHAAGHPHRDVKPQNVIELADENGDTNWVLADWGLTRRPPGQTTAEPTKTGQFLGSVGFAPPEAYLDAHNVGVPGDVYALGQVIAWATGVDPVPNMSPRVAPPWRSLVEVMTQIEAGRRPQTMAEVQRLLSSVSLPGDETE